MTLDMVATAPKTVRDGLLQIDPPALIGSHCAACGTNSFPVRDFCPACLHEDELSERALSPGGTVFSYTIVRQAPPGWDVPYALAYIDLDDRVRVMAQVEDAVDTIAIGARAHLVLRPLDRDGERFVHYAFALEPGA